MCYQHPNLEIYKWCPSTQRVELSQKLALLMGCLIRSNRSKSNTQKRTSCKKVSDQILFEHILGSQHNARFRLDVGLRGKHSSKMLSDLTECIEAGKYSRKTIRKTVTMVMSFGSDLSTRLGSFPVSLVIMTKSAQKEKIIIAHNFY